MYGQPHFMPPGQNPNHQQPHFNPQPQFNPGQHGQQFGQPQTFQNVTFRSYTNPKHYLFVSNDNHRNYNSDFDVRTHTHQEDRNKFVVEHFGNGVCCIKHQVSNQYLFGADDGSRKYGEDFDVRTHTHDEQRNKVTLMKTQHPGVYAIQLPAKQHYIFCSDDGVNGYGQDFDVRTHPHVEDRNMWIVEGFSY